MHTDTVMLTVIELDCSIHSNRLPLTVYLLTQNEFSYRDEKKLKIPKLVLNFCVTKFSR